MIQQNYINIFRSSYILKHLSKIVLFVFEFYECVNTQQTLYFIRHCNSRFLNLDFQGTASAIRHSDPLIIISFRIARISFSVAWRVSYWTARGILAGNTRGRSSATWGNSQRDYRRRITVSPRPDTNWSHATVTGGASVRAHDAVNTYTFVRVLNAHTERCTGATSVHNEEIASSPVPQVLFVIIKPTALALYLY